jgi:hypothetical protein
MMIYFSVLCIAPPNPLSTVGPDNLPQETMRSYLCWFVYFDLVLNHFEDNFEVYFMNNAHKIGRVIEDAHVHS